MRVTKGATPWAKLGQEDRLDIGLESITVDRPREHEGRDHAAQSEGSDDGHGLPVTMWHDDLPALP
ncbi:MAG: hypothetical protein KDJ81_00010, partial [Rhodobacteraceae bacterium]|nr:hypothetical protein [Paracoccaceae bacterium]